MIKKKKLGNTPSFVHGKIKNVICHDMRKYVWLKQEEKKKNKVKSKKKKGL